jgi:plastocyanin
LFLALQLVSQPQDFLRNMHKKIILSAGVLVILGVIGFFVFRPVEKAENLPRQISSAPSTAAVTVMMTADGFSPSEFSIKKGQAVDFVNAASPTCNPASIDCQFWPASNLHPDHSIYPEFDPRQPVVPGQVWTFVFDRLGDWGFHDHFHFTNRGVVRVSE